MPEVNRRVSHQNPVSGSLNWLHTPTMSSIRLCWVTDMAAPRADLWIAARRNREREEIIILRGEEGGGTLVNCLVGLLVKYRVDTLY